MADRVPPELLDDMHPVQREMCALMVALTGKDAQAVVRAEGITDPKTGDEMAVAAFVADGMLSRGAFTVPQMALAMILLGIRLKTKGIV